jgi:hypothetical protein
MPVFYIRNPNVPGFSIDANTPHLSAEANGTFDDVVQLYAAPGSINPPDQLQNVHISSNGPADVVVGGPTTIVNNPNINAANGYELNFADGSLVDVWQQAQVGTSDLGDIYASYNGSTHVVFDTPNTDTLLGATALADGNIAVLVSSGNQEEIVIQSKDGSGTPIHLQLTNPWNSNPQNGTISQLADGNLVVTFLESQPQQDLLHLEVISEQGVIGHDWTNPSLGDLADTPSEPPIIPFTNSKGAGYLAIYGTLDKGPTLYLDVAVFYGADPAPITSNEDIVGLFPAPSDVHPTGARLLDGSFVIAWDYQGRVYARNYHFDSTNTNLVPDGGAYLVSGLHSPFDPPVTEYAPSVVALADGRYAIAWEEVGQNYYTSKATIFDTRTSGVTLKAPDTGADFVGTPFNDTFIGGAGNDTFTPNGGTDSIDGGGGWNTVVYNFASTAANIQHNANGSWLIFGTGFTDTITNVQVAQFTDKTVFLDPVFNASLIQAEDFAITRTTLPLDQATSIANSINSGAQTEAQFINNLLSQDGDTTIPAVAVEGSMYNAVGTSAEITLLVTHFLPAQVANAIHNGFNPQVYACEALGLAFAFGDENGGTAFDTHFGPANAQMPATAQGDQAFAAAAASTIFGSAANANTPAAILGFVTNWKAFYTSHGIPGIPNASADQIDLAARGAAWGDAVGVAVNFVAPANNLGLLSGQVLNFLEDAARGTATYGASLSSQPNHPEFLGETAASAAASATSEVQLTGVAAPSDHVLMWHG